MSRVVNQDGIVAPQHPSVWAFGGLPADLAGAGAGENFVNFGAGDVVSKFNLPSFELFGGTHYFSDPKITDAAERARDKGVNAHNIKGIVEAPLDTLLVFNNTPPHVHLPIVEASMKAGMPVATEKPVVTNISEMKHMLDLAKDTLVPLISIDWIFGQSQVLRAVAGEGVPFAKYVTIQKDSKFDQFDWKNLTSISAHSVEGGGNVLSQGVMDRAGMGDCNKGGGVLWDMIVHQTTLLSHMGFNTRGIADVVLGSPTVTAGQYDRFGKEDGPNSRGEIYGRAEILMEDRQGKAIPVTLECGKLGEFNHQEIVFKDAKGNTLRWQTVMNNEQGQVSNAGGTWVELTDKQGKVTGFASQAADAYALVLADAINIARDFRNGAKPEAHYLNSQVNPTFAIAAMHVFARSAPIDEVAHQLPLSYVRPKFAPKDYTPVSQLVA